jgi:MYXO-CTERM domain-containing protein
MLGALVPLSAHADLTGEFADALEVDSEYLTGANGATDIAFAPDGRAVVTRKSGQITIRNTDGTTEQLSGTFEDVDTASEKGLLGVVAHPTEANAFFFYVANGPSDDDKHRVYKGVLNDDNSLTVDTMNPIVGPDVNPGDPGLEGPANHDGGGLFIYDNHLYVGVGDTGANSTPPSNKYSSCLNKPNGKILRVNLDGSIPDDNPLSDVDEVTSCDAVREGWTTDAPDRRVFAWGFRNPWRFWIDPHSDRMWIGDVGERTREEISVSDPVLGFTGQHFGYPFDEGIVEYGDLDGKNCNTDFEPALPCTGPVHDYKNALPDDGEPSVGSSVTAGLIPEGCGWAEAFGGTLHYFFADYGASWIHTLEVEPDRSGPVSSEAIDAGDVGAGPVSFRQGPGDAMYVVLYGAGAVVAIKPRVQSGDGCESTGGSGGAGGMSGSGGEPSGAGGEPSGAGGSTGGSSAGSGGGMTTGGRAGSGASGNAGRGGSAGMAGNSAAGSAGTPSGGDDDDDGGCGCRVVGETRGSLSALLATLVLAAGVLARRRVRAKRPPR